MQIRLNHKLFALAALLLGAVMAVGLSRAISNDNVVAALLVIAVLGGPFLFYVRGFTRRGPAIIIDREGLSGFRTSRSLPWDDVGDIYVSQQQGMFGIHHSLVITLRREDLPPLEDAHGICLPRVSTEEREISIDQLARPWADIVKLIEARLGRTIPVHKTVGFRAVRA